METGRGAYEDAEAARAYWAAAAHLGDAGAMVLLGDLLSGRALGPHGRDEKLAVGWWRRAAHMGSAEAARKVRDWAPAGE